MTELSSDTIDRAKQLVGMGKTATFVILESLEPDNERGQIPAVRFCKEGGMMGHYITFDEPRHAIELIEILNQQT